MPDRGGLVSSNGFLLEMQHVSKEFPGVRALDDVSLQVRPGTVHALMGENGAGKSTLMKCLFGLYAPDQGEIFLDGRPIQIAEPKVALSHGISMIHQELHPIPHRSVMENIWLGRFPLRKIGPLPFVDHSAMYKATEALFKDLGMNIDPATRLGNLSVSKIQSVEIAKAVSYRSKVIIMDEPTSSLTENEVEHLFRIIRDLRARGVAIIYISHKMEEILKISDEVTIMRDGRRVGTWPAGELTEDLIIRNMVGRDLTHRFPERHNVPGEVILRVTDLTSPLPRSFKNVSFELRRGEILGIGGLVGAQRTELVEAIFGMRSILQGRIELGGKAVAIAEPSDAKRLGMALLTEDRRGSGIFPALSVLENSLIADLRRYVRGLLLDDKARKKAANRMVERLRVKTPSLATLIRDLSGGNQQKVLFGRWLLTEPEILLLDEPTRGIDVGAKFEIYTIVEELARQGKSIVMISSEMPELLGMSDRIMVMCEGRVSGFLEGKSASQEEIMRLAAQFM
jgi:methyl-galactoside transport system ATP-binding protein